MTERGALLLPLLLIGCAQYTPSAPTSEGDDGEWPSAPIRQLGGDEGDEDDESEEGSDDSGLSFIVGTDFGGCSCDPFAQDCPAGEKCVPFASFGETFDANKCVPVTGAGEPGDPCTHGGVVEATDDCNALGICWVVDGSMGTCAAFCGGTADAPECAEGFGCLIAYEGSVDVCLPEEALAS